MQFQPDFMLVVIHVMSIVMGHTFMVKNAS